MSTTIDLSRVCNRLNINDHGITYKHFFIANTNICTLCNQERTVIENATLARAYRRLEAEINVAIRCMQQHQPGGSPPPGNWVMLLDWILKSKANELEQQTKVENNLYSTCDTIAKSLGLTNWELNDLIAAVNTMQQELTDAKLALTELLLLQYGQEPKDLNKIIAKHIAMRNDRIKLDHDLNEPIDGELR